MGAKRETLLGDLDGVVDDADPDDLPDVAVADAVAGTRAADRT